MKAWIIIADAAEAVGGKLYLLGGGIYMVGPGPFKMGVAIIGTTAWEDRGRRIDARLTLKDGNNQPALVPTPMGLAPLEAQVSFEIVPAAGSPPGCELPFTFALNVGGVPLAPGDYSWCLYMAGQEQPVAKAGFTVRPEQLTPQQNS